MTRFRYRAIALDFDGVLVDSVPVKDQALRTLFESHGSHLANRALATWNSHRGVFRSERLRRTVEETLGRSPSSAEVTALTERFATLVRDRTIAAPWIAGARDLLENLHHQLPCFVVSAAPQEELREIINQRGMTPLFTEVFGGPEKKAPILQRIAATLPCPTDALLFLGDSPSDLTAAQQAGTPFLGVVAPGLANPFPTEIPTVADLSTVENRIVQQP
ncbi:MAG: HAD family hydrolase [Magnetococcales bacterium]|nr:HAD family hydrolase [Magnetococcales bacterium]